MENYIKCSYNGKYFKPKRSNQKYASKYNRVALHNKQFRKSRFPLERVNQKLYKNFNIISDLVGNNNEIIVSNDYLKVRKYDFNYRTHFHNEHNKTYFGLYDFVFIKVDASKMKFLKK
jgi:hypothetical protein